MLEGRVHELSTGLVDQLDGLGVSDPVIYQVDEQVHWRFVGREKTYGARVDFPSSIEIVRINMLRTAEALVAQDED